MNSRLVAAAAAFVAVAAGSLATAPSASAAVYASSGARCTKVGTAGADNITGTAGADVICGLGGNDRLVGVGGNDTIDGGLGNDTIYGGFGADTIYGGAGNDKIYAQQDNDKVNAGAGDDYVLGYSGNDRIDGSTGDDVVDGSTGNDVVVGNIGNDTLIGGVGDDTVSGGAGRDKVNGNDGNDDLLGGPDPDVITGGNGTNWCEIAAGDIRYSCKTDTEPAQAVGVSLSPAAVDVTSAPQVTTYRIRVTDDTGVTSVQVGAQHEDGLAGYATGGLAHLVSGTIRDGWWSGTLKVPMYIDPGAMTVNVFVADRVGRQSTGGFPGALTVASRSTDLQPPVVASFSLNRTALDVRTTAKTVTATVRLTDDRAGIGETPYLCAYRPANGAYLQLGCENLQHVSGTTRDGIWTASHVIEAGEIGGIWNFAVWVEDASSRHGMQYYNGPDLRAFFEARDGAGTGGLALPGGSGRFVVTGTGDSNAPVLTRMTMTPSELPLSGAPQQVVVDVTATDVEGVGNVSLYLSNAEGGVWLYSSSDPTLVSGTRKSGVWRHTVTVPGGTPPGTYFAQVVVEDATHWTSYVSPGSPHAGTPSQTVLSPTQLAGGPGVLTVG